MSYGLIADHQIKYLVAENDFINPFVDSLVRQDEQGNPVISYGLSSYGYDVRLADEFLIFSALNPVLVDPKNFGDVGLHKVVVEPGMDITVPPNGFLLSHTVEYFKIPNDVLGLCVGKSTFARCAIHVNVTPLEPGWEGQVTLEISNGSPLPVKLYPGEGICQFLFFRAQSKCSISYADRHGKYQGQTGVVLPKV